MEEKGGENLNAMVRNNPLNRIDVLGQISTMDNGGGGGNCDRCAYALSGCLATADRHLREQQALIDGIQDSLTQLGDRPYIFYPEVNPYNPGVGCLGWLNLETGFTETSCPKAYDDYLYPYINILRKDAQIRNLKEKIKCQLDYEDCKRK